MKGVIAAAIALPALRGMAQAQVTDNDGCSNATLKGDYGFRIHGKLLGIKIAAGPQIFLVPLLIDGVAMTYFDGKGKLDQVDYVLRNGVKNPGQPDLQTGFNTNEPGQYTVFADCTGQFEIDVPAVLIEVKFVLADQGRQIYGVESRQRVVKGIPVGGISCDIPAGCELLPQLHSDGTKLQAGLGNKH